MPVDAAEGQTTAHALLDAALAVVGEQGIRGATTRLIAQRAGVNEVTLFRKFGSKSSLIKEAMVSRLGAFERDAVVYSGDVEADLIRLADHYSRALQTIGPAVRVLFTEVPYDAEFAEGLGEARRVFAAIGALLVRYQSEGVLREEVPEAMAQAFLGPMLLPHITPIGEGAGATPFDARTHVSRFLFGRAGR